MTITTTTTTTTRTMMTETQRRTMANKIAKELLAWPYQKEEEETTGDFGVQLNTRTKVNKVMSAYGNDRDIFDDDTPAEEACNDINWEGIKDEKK